MKKIKNKLLLLGSTIGVLAPITVAISCNFSFKEKEKQPEQPQPEQPQPEQPQPEQPQPEQPQPEQPQPEQPQPEQPQPETNKTISNQPSHSAKLRRVEEQKTKMIIVSDNFTKEQWEKALEKALTRKEVEQISDNLFKIHLYKYKNQLFLGFYGGGSDESRNGFMHFTEEALKDPSINQIKGFDVWAEYNTATKILKIKHKTSLNTFEQIIDINNLNGSSNEDLNSNQIHEEEIVGDKTIYVRPPFGASFQFVDSSLNLPNITTIFDHLDSPGATANREEAEASAVLTEGGYVTVSNLKKNGVQELSEFVAIPRVMRYFQAIGNSKDFVIFGGDTNIKDSNFYLQKHSLFNGINPVTAYLPSKTQLSQKDDYITSLGTKDNYSQPYDKMFFINNTLDKLFVNQATSENFKSIKFKVDIVKGFYNGLWDKKEIKDALEGSDVNKTDFQIIRSVISDHAPVYTDVVLKNKTLATNQSTFS
nr:hypothetical protein [Mycoplasmopsis gallopavonis]